MSEKVQYERVSGGGGVIFEKGIARAVSENNVRTKTEYMDTLIKARHYNESIIKSLAKYGEIISDKSIADKIDNIDLYQPIYRHLNVKAKHHFDTKRFNDDTERIEKDLIILYDLVRTLGVDRLNRIKEYADTHIREMELQAERYAARIAIESNSSALGKNVVYTETLGRVASNGNKTFYDLGQHLLKEGSTLGFIVEGEGVTHDSIRMGISIGNKTNYIAPYNYMNDVFEVPGEKRVTSYTRSFDTSMVLSSGFDITPEELGVEAGNRYVAFGGTNKINVTQGSVTKVVPRSDDYAFHVDQDWEVNFYIKGGTYARFDFSREITNKNFQGAEILNMQKVQVVKMKSQSEFGFNVYTDGIIYAEKETLRIEGETIRYPKESRVHDFLIEEYATGEDVVANIIIENVSEEGVWPIIRAVALKELVKEDALNDLL